MREYYVYILRCRDGSYYTGVTNDYEKRFLEHQGGMDPMCYTYKRRPVVLVYRATFGEILDAIAFEKKVKGWKRRKKEALIQGDEKLLHQLSICCNFTHHSFVCTHARKNIRVMVSGDEP